MKPSSEAAKDIKTHVQSILLPVVYTILLLGFAFVIYFYANGYRVDLFNQSIIQTGVINIESNVNGAQLSLNGKVAGKAPKSTSLEVGSYDIKVESDSFYPWEKQINILEGKSATFYSWLIKQNPQSTEVWKSSGKLVKNWTADDNSYLITLIKNSDNTYNLWRYNSAPALWDFSSNPLNLTQLTSDKITVAISPNKNQILLSLTDKDNKIQYYILGTQNATEFKNLTPLTIDNTKGYTLSWSNDNNYLLLESKNTINAYNIKNGTIVTLLTKKTNTQYVWTTDDEGYLYVTEPSTASDTNSYSYNLKQISLDGTTSQYIIENLYFQKTDEYIEQYRKNGFTTAEFSTSPDSTLSGGEITSINVDQTAKGMFLKTSLAAYWFNMETQKFVMISAYPADLISYSNDNKKLLFKDEIQYGIFTFDKTEGDYMTEIGSKKIKNISDISKVSNMQWISNSLYITYQEDNNIYIADKDGENKSLITSNEKYRGHTVKANLSTMILYSESDDNLLKITEYKLE